IDREIAHVKAGRSGFMLVKLNGLEDQDMIDKLYEASQAGVKIELIVRGICCLRAGVPGMSENIRITRLVDRFLEHARVFYFANGAEADVENLPVSGDLYLASADWMTRNLSRRVETAFPIMNASLKNEILHMLRLQLADNTKAVHLNADMENISVAANPDAPVRAQEDAYWLVERGELGNS
ncbi:MAG: polyphosphate kinase 1, partial [Bacteroidia bacterium]